MTTSVAPTTVIAAAKAGVTNADQHPRTSRPSRRFLGGLGIAAVGGLALRVYGVLGYRRDFRLWGDSFFYSLQGRVLAEGHGFIDPFRFYKLHVVRPTAGHPPLYGLYLAVVWLLGGHTATVQRLASCLLGAAAVVVIGLLVRGLAGERAGLVAAGIAALYPALWINDYMLLSESMATLTVSLALLACYRFWRDPDLGSAILIGVTFGLAALTRAELVLLFPLVALPFALRARDVDLGRRFQLLGATALAGLVVVGPWVGYNLSRFEKPVFLSNGFGASLSAASCDAAYSGAWMGFYACAYRSEPGRTTFKPVHNGVIGPVINGDESVGDEVVRRAALEYVGDHVDRLPVVISARLGRLWEVYRPSQVNTLDGALEGRGYKGILRGRGPSAVQLAMGAYYVLMPFAIGGLVVMRRRRVPILPLLTLAVGVSLAAAATFGVLRYRAPADVGIVVAAAIGIDSLWQLLRDGRRAPSDVSGASDAR